MGRNPRLCPACRAIAKRQMNWRCNRRVRLRGYGLTVEHYDAMMRVQFGRCAVCHTDENGGREFSVDHDHDCCPERERSCGRCVRALLCLHCNANRLTDEMVLLKATYIMFWRDAGRTSGAEHLQRVEQWIAVQLGGACAIAS